jgi:hypothetical protein
MLFSLMLSVHIAAFVLLFLGLTMLRVTDASLTLLDHRIAALWRAARERAEEARASRLRRFRELLGDLAGLAGDEALDAAELRSRLHGLIARFETERDTTQVSAIRQELGRKSQDLARLLKTARARHWRFRPTISSPPPSRHSMPLRRRRPPPCRTEIPSRLVCHGKVLSSSRIGRRRSAAFARRP